MEIIIGHLTALLLYIFNFISHGQSNVYGFYYAEKGGGVMVGGKTGKSPEEIVAEQNSRHKGNWLTYGVAAQYHKKAALLGYGNNELKGERFRLCKELQEKYGVTELEAINILNGRCITDYVEKYQRIKNHIPLKVDKKKKAKDMEENV